MEKILNFFKSLFGIEDTYVAEDDEDEVDPDVLPGLVYVKIFTYVDTNRLVSYGYLCNDNVEADVENWMLGRIPLQVLNKEKKTFAVYSPAMGYRSFIRYMDVPF